MELIILEMPIKYDRFIKFFLNLIPILFISLVLIFYFDFKIKDILPGQTFRSEADFYLFSLVMLGAAFLYKLFFPKSALITREGLVIKFPIFSWKIPFRQIKTIKEKPKGPFHILAFKWLTSKEGAILIERKRKPVILICVNQANYFMETANSFLEEWRRFHPGL